jgi:hypothetical protein
LVEVIAWVAVVFLVLVTLIMIAGFVWWVVAWIRRRNRGW